MNLNCNGLSLDLNIAKVMVIINLTPDSFYSNSRYTHVSEINKAVSNAIEEGASIIDLGAVSSRPGADMLSFEEEKERIAPIFKALRKTFPNTIFSIDTFRSKIAHMLLNEGANIINDISGGALDDKMYDVISKFPVPYILMHMKGTPETMTSHTQYENILMEIMAYFTNRLMNLKKLGVRDVIIDPGFGFAKSIEDNYRILKYLNVFKVYDCPILAGISRKSMIYKPLEIDPESSLSATSALHMIALQQGGKILRVHDVKEAAEVIKLHNLLQSQI